MGPAQESRALSGEVGDSHPGNRTATSSILAYFAIT